MPARDVVDISILSIGLAGGNIELQEVMSFDTNETNSGAVVIKTMRRDRIGIGYAEGVVEHDADLEVRIVSSPEVDYKALQRSGELFQLFYEENSGGAKFHLVDCKVIETPKSFNADGEAILKVKVLALDHIPES